MTEILLKKIGIAGCGSMGYPMLRVLIKNGIEATGYDVRDKHKFSAIKHRFIPNKIQFINENDVIISVVRDINQTEELCGGKNGVFNSKKTKILIICSTLSPKYLHVLRKKAPKTLKIIDAPMSGAPVRAKTGKLTFMVGGTKCDVDFIRPLLNIMANRIINLGSYGAGMSAKVLNNFVTASFVVAVRNAMSEAVNLGISIEQLIEVLAYSSGKNWYSDNIENIDWAKENYDPKNTIGILEKDVESFFNAISDNTVSFQNTGITNLKDSLLSGLRNIPEYPQQ